MHLNFIHYIYPFILLLKETELTIAIWSVSRWDCYQRFAHRTCIEQSVIHVDRSALLEPTYFEWKNVVARSKQCNAHVAPVILKISLRTPNLFANLSWYSTRLPLKSCPSDFWLRIHIYRDHTFAPVFAVFAQKRKRKRRMCAAWRFSILQKEQKATEHQQ